MRSSGGSGIWIRTAWRRCGYFLTSCKTFQKIRETRKRGIRKNLNPGNDTSEQLAVLNGGLFSFCLFICPAE